MSVVCGLDLHRQQITFDALESESGEVWRGRVWQPDRERFGVGCVATSVEGCTGWRYVVEESVAAASKRLWRSRRTRKPRVAASGMPRPIARTPGCCASCCSPAICPSRGSRRRMCWSGANGCGSTSRWSINGGCGSSGSTPSCSSTTSRRRARGGDRSTVTRDRLLGDEVDLTPAGRQRVRVGYSMLEATDVEAQSLKRELQRFDYYRRAACRALVETTLGIGGLIVVAVWSELGDCRRFSRSEQVVRHSGLDVSVESSDSHRAHGHLIRQGPPTLRWALFEAAMNASHRSSPDHAYYATGQ
jgi:Transposase IS116/IS110/IS902 family